MAAYKNKKIIMKDVFQMVLPKSNVMWPVWSGELSEVKIQEMVMRKLFKYKAPFFLMVL